MEDDPELLLRRQLLRRRIVLALGLVALGAVSVYPCVRMGCAVEEELAEDAAREAERAHTATPDQIAEVDRACGVVEASLASREEAFVTAASALTNDNAFLWRPTDTPCETHIPLRAPASAERGFSVSGTDDFEVLGFGGEPTFPWTPIGTASSTRVTLARREITRLRHRIREQGTLEDLARLVEDAHALESSFWSYEVLVATDVWRAPRATTAGLGFEPGYVHGRAFVYDHGARAITCVGEFEASNTSETVEYRAGVLEGERSLERMLSAELDAEIERGIARARLTTVQPPVSADEEGAPPEP